MTNRRGNNLTVRSLTLQLPGGRALCEDLSFSIEPGDVMVLMGPSGCGKSSILSWLTGTLAPELSACGEIWLGEQSLTRCPTEHRQLGLMLQQDYLFPHMTVGENLQFGLRGGTRTSRRQRVENALQAAGLEHMSHRDPASLSGGQRARVSLLRTLLSEPRNPQPTCRYCWSPTTSRTFHPAPT